MASSFQQEFERKNQMEMKIDALCFVCGTTNALTLSIAIAIAFSALDEIW